MSYQLVRHLIIVADDLTGAADSAARAFDAGLPATIYLRPVPAAWPPGVVAFSSDSRFLPPGEAAEQVRTLVAALRAPPATWYKKIDSTLRGNIGAELDAMLGALARPDHPTVAVVCPAFPAQRRGLADGMLILSGQQEPLLYLPALITRETARPVALLPLEIVEKGTGALAAAMRAAAGQGAQILVVDALSDDDLATLLAATQRVLPHALLCGSAGLVAPLARSLIAQEGFAPATTHPPPLPMRPPLLAVVGSGSTMAHRQIDALRGQNNLSLIEVDQDQSAPVGLEPTSKRGVIVHLPKPAAGTILEGERARSLAAALADTAARLAEVLQPGLIVLVGGDTAVHTLERLDIYQLTVRAEVMPGIPLLTGVTSGGEKYNLITKAGSFGDEVTLVRIIDLLGENTVSGR